MRKTKEDIYTTIQCLLLSVFFCPYFRTFEVGSSVYLSVCLFICLSVYLTVHLLLSNSIQLTGAALHIPGDTSADHGGGCGAGPTAAHPCICSRLCLQGWSSVTSSITTIDTAINSTSSSRRVGA